MTTPAELSQGELAPFALEKDELLREPFEGNWNAWRSKLDEGLRNRGTDLRPYLTEDASCATKAEYDPVSFTKNSTQATLVIANAMSATVLGRVPSEHLMDPPKLLRSLKALAQPFRFMDLSAELRNAVYDCMPELHKFDRFSNEAIASYRRTLGTLPRFPAITQASSRLRKETRPILFHGVSCTLDLEWDLELSEKDARSEIQSWLEVIGPEIRHVRDFAVLSTHRNFDACLDRNGRIACNVSFGFRYDNSVLKQRIDDANKRLVAGTESANAGQFFLDNIDIWLSG